MRLSANKPCPCHSGRKTKSCCGPVLAGAPAVSPEALMRSRFTAYATGNVRHIIETTHPEGPHHQPNLKLWTHQIQRFCDEYAFHGLTIHTAGEELTRGWVKFTAHLSATDQDASFTEHSLFIKQQNQWLYHSAMAP